MKKIIVSILIIAPLALAVCRAQDSTNVLSNPTVSAFQSLLANGSNFFAVPYGMVSTDGKDYGGGLAIGYKASDYLAPVVRLDYFGRERSIYSASIGLQLQLPVHVGSVLVTPFAFSSLAMNLSGGNQDVPIGIMGVGAAVHLNDRFFLVGDYERWTGIQGDQLRFGVGFHF